MHGPHDSREVLDGLAIALLCLLGGVCLDVGLAFLINLACGR
jgi:hypothetical protein